MKNILGHIIDAVTAPIRNNGIFYVSMFALFAISALFVLYYGSRAAVGLEIFFDLYILALLVYITPACLRKHVKRLLFFLFFVIGVVDMLSFVAMGAALSPNILTTWMQTNSDEASEAVVSYFGRDVLFSPVILFFLLPFAVIILKRIGFRIGRRLSAILAAVTVVSFIYGYENKVYICRTHMLDGDDTMVEVCDYKNISREYLPHYRLLYSLKELNRFSGMLDGLEKNIRMATIDSCSHKSPLIVLVIGESYNRHHASLYGYDKPTTPRQSERFNSGGLYRFNDAVASYNLTFKAFQNMLSLYDYDKPGSWYEYPLLTTLFRKAGYKVGFFSNQFCLDKRASFSEVVDDIFINNERLSPLMFDERNPLTMQYDLELIGVYDKRCLGKWDGPQLVIFHLIGMHADFSKRYPSEYALFGGDDYRRTDLNDKERQTLAEYDNAILYNDFVLDSIIKRFDNREAVIIHCPDHGEVVYDNSTLFGRKLYFSKDVVVPQFDIPFTIYCSPLYRQNHGDICDMIERSVDRPFMTDDLSHLLLFLAGIECAVYEDERNLIGDKYNEERVRRICGEVDYDVLCD